jgi:hypothetical protein
MSACQECMKASNGICGAHYIMAQQPLASSVIYSEFPLQVQKLNKICDKLDKIIRLLEEIKRR